MNTMTTATAATFACLLVFTPLAAVAIQDPQAVRDATPEVVVCRISDVVAVEGDEISSYSAQCAVQEVIRSSLPISPGDRLTIAYEVHHAVFDKPWTTDPGLAFPMLPPPLHDGGLITAYLHRATNPAGETIFVPHIGIDSFQQHPGGL